MFNLSVSLSLDSSPSRGASGEEAKLYDMPKPPLLGEVARRRRDGEVVPLLKKPPGLKVPAAMGFLLQGVLQSLARLEHDALGSSDGDGLAGAGVDALTLSALTHFEGAEA